jgi:hypothetical protein
MADGATLIIDPEFKAIIPPLSASERDMLERSIVAEGCRDPLTVWNRIIVDGHNRYEICTAHGIRFSVVRRSFSDRNEAIRWIVTNQLARRNLNPLQAAYFRGAVYERLRDSVPRKGVNLKRGDKVIVGKSTMEDAGKLFGVSEGKIRNDYRIKCALDRMGEDARTYFLSGVDRIRHSWILELSQEGPEECGKIIAAIESGGETMKEAVHRNRAKYVGTDLPGRCRECGGVAYGNRCTSCSTTTRRKRIVADDNEDADLSFQLDAEAELRLRSIQDSRNAKSQIVAYAEKLMHLIDDVDKPTTHERRMLIDLRAKIEATVSMAMARTK